MKLKWEYDQRGMNRAISAYLDIKKNLDPKKEIRRRAKNVSLRLIRLYKKEAPDASEIRQKVTSLGNRVLIRQRIRQLDRSLEKKIKAEVQARINARMFTATGWFPSAEALGAQPKIAQRVTGPKRGRIKQDFHRGKALVTMTNSQPAADYMDKRSNLLSQALRGEINDILTYVQKKLDQAARRNGL